MMLHLYNTLTRRKETLDPIDVGNVRMYVCGPTVYDRPHLGNARSVVVYDVLYRLLRHLYGEACVTYVRNITDVDDKINARAKERGISIGALTQEVTAQFHADMGALGVLRPTHEPRATDHIGAMHDLIRKLLDNGHAYVSDGHVLFDVASVPHYRPEMGSAVEGYVYGMLSHRVQDELVAGARVEVENYKRNPGDFVLWKPAEPGDDPSSVFESLWGPGRPGWHIECSAMSRVHLGDTFDLHGGGADLMFPHHENEIAQSRCANKKAEFAKMWVHNGFLTVNGEKMSKSLGNFVTVYDLLPPQEDKTAWKNVGENIRLALLSSKYNEPLDWSKKLLEDSKKTLNKWYRKLPDDCHPGESQGPDWLPASAGMTAFVEVLCDDMNMPKAFSLMHQADEKELYAMGRLLGFFGMTQEERFKGYTLHAEAGHYTLTGNPVGMNTHKGAGAGSGQYILNINPTAQGEQINQLIAARIAAKQAKNYAEADRIRKELADQEIILEDRPDGTTDWRRA